MRRPQWKSIVLNDSADGPDTGDLPSVAGVYVLFRSRRRAWYVGQSGNIRKRIRQYVRQSCIAMTWVTPWGYFRKLTIKFRPETHTWERLGAERRLIERLKPQANLLGNRQ